MPIRVIEDLVECEDCEYADPSICFPGEMYFCTKGSPRFRYPTDYCSQGKRKGGIELKPTSGVIRRIDDLGRIVIPKALREQYNIQEGDPLEILCAGDYLCLKKHIPSCNLCGRKDATKQVGSRQLCDSCLNELKVAGYEVLPKK